MLKKPAVVLLLMSPHLRNWRVIEALDCAPSALEQIAARR